MKNETDEMKRNVSESDKEVRRTKTHKAKARAKLCGVCVVAVIVAYFFFQLYVYIVYILYEYNEIESSMAHDQKMSNWMKWFLSEWVELPVLPEIIYFFDV